MKILKNVGLILVSIVFLNGCFNFGSGNSTAKVTTDERTKIIDNSSYDFTITIPREWDMIEKKDFTKDVPPETVLVFRNNIKNEDWTAAVVITKANFQIARDSLEVAKYVLNREKTSLYEFKEVRDRELRRIKTGNQQTDTYVSYFQGKEKADSTLIQYIQTYASRGNTAYIVTGSISTKENENNRKTVEDIVKSFALK